VNRWNCLTFTLFSSREGEKSPTASLNSRDTSHCHLAPRELLQSLVNSTQCSTRRHPPLAGYRIRMRALTTQKNTHLHLACTSTSPLSLERQGQRRAQVLDLTWRLKPRLRAWHFCMHESVTASSSPTGCHAHTLCLIRSLP
jgi:hypothetical protein